MNINIELDVIFHSNSPDPEKMVKEIEEAQASKMTFFDIGAISPFFISPVKEYSVIHSYGNNFIIPISYTSLKIIIDNEIVRGYKQKLTLQSN